jgi:hypothetical protein
MVVPIPHCGIIPECGMLAALDAQKGWKLGMGLTNGQTGST